MTFPKHKLAASVAVINEQKQIPMVQDISVMQLSTWGKLTEPPLS